MSTVTMSLPVSSYIPQPHRIASKSAKIGRDQTESVIAAAHIHATDRILIMGSKVIEPLLALVRAGCQTVSSLRAEMAYPKKEAVDVLWLTGVDEVTGRLNSALSAPTTPRIVVIEVNGAGFELRVRAIARQLRGKGFVRFTLHRTNGGIALVAARPEWLQKVL